MCTNSSKRREESPQALAVVILALTLCACSGGHEQVTEVDHSTLVVLGAKGRASGYNLLLISVDTLRADRLGCYGHPDARTPFIDALAAAGLRFEHATSGVPLTLPAHATMMTGLDAPDHGVRHNGSYRLADERTTLAEVLAANGYATAAIIGAFVLDRRFGLAQGFDHYDDAVNPHESGSPAMGAYNERPADQVVDAAIGWLDQLDAATAQPFMLWVHLFDPHAPYAAPPEFRERFPHDPYQAEVAFADAEIGRLVEHLRKLERFDDTLVVFTSDHGEGLGEHDEETHGDLIYDSTLRVPLVLSNPTLFPQSLVIDDRLAGLVDLFTTLLEFLGVTHAATELGGVNVLASRPAPTRAIYIETLAPLLDYGWAPLHGLRRLEDKFILAPSPEYYAVLEDPHERENLYGRVAASESLRQLLARRMEDWPSALEAARLGRPMSDEEIERLAALGYVRSPHRPEEIGVKNPVEMMGLWRRMIEAGELSLNGEHQRAAEAIEAVLREDPLSAKGWYTALRIYDRAGDYERAELCVRRALELNPLVEGWIVLARYTLSRGDRESFERALAEAERLDPLDGGIYIGRGHALAMSGEFEAARRQFEKAIEVDPVRSGRHARAQLQRLDRQISRN
jgi:arylsulfatase A-like enzyme